MITLNEPFLPDGRSALVPLLNRIAGLVERPCVLWLSARIWAVFAKEIAEQYADRLMMPGNLPTPANFKQVRIGLMLVRNSGTDDKEVIWHLQRETANQTDFTAIWQRLATGSGAAPPVEQ